MKCHFKRLLSRGAPSTVTVKEEGPQRDVKIWNGGPSARNAAEMGDHFMLMDPQPKRLSDA